MNSPETQNHLGRNTPVNGPLLKYYREQRQLTQAQLAAKAGFTSRLIVKAEAGKSLAVDTVDSIAQALTESGGEAVYLEDLISDPIALARRYVAALYTSVDGEGFVNAIRDFLAKDVTFVVSGDPAKIPFAGEWNGIEAVQRGFQLFFSIMQAPADHDYNKHYHYIAQGSDVVAWGDSHLHPKGQPMPKPMSVSNLFRFRQGKLHRFEDNYDTHWASEVLD